MTKQQKEERKAQLLREICNEIKLLNGPGSLSSSISSTLECEESRTT